MVRLLPVVVGMIIGGTIVAFSLHRSRLDNRDSFKKLDSTDGYLEVTGGSVRAKRVYIGTKDGKLYMRGSNGDDNGDK